MTGSPLTPEVTHLEGIRQTVFVGEAMTSSAPLIVVGTVNLKSKIATITPHKHKSIKLEASPGIYTLIRKNTEGNFYESSEGLFRVNGKVSSGGLFLANQSSAHSALYWSASATLVGESQQMSMYVSGIEVTPEVTTSTFKRPPNNSQGFVSTLTYTGVASGQIKFVYREFGNGLARAAFTQEVSLDYLAGRAYSYKSARFIVHEADTSQVSFTLLQSL